MKATHLYSFIMILGFIVTFTPTKAQTWNKVSTPEMGNAQHFTVHNNQLLVTTAGAGPHVTTNGKDWTQKKEGLDGYGIQGAGIAALGSWIYYASKGNIHRSSDGEKWDTAGVGITVSANNYVRWFYEFDGTYFCVMSAAITNGGGIYRSTDGLNWTQATTGMEANNTCLKMTKIGSKLYVGTNLDFFESTDDGLNWSTALPGKKMLHNAMTSVKGRWMMFTSLGVIYSDDQGSNWKDAEDDPRGTIQCGFIEGPNDTLFSWAATSGIYYSLDTGATWTDYSGNLTSNDKSFMQDVVLYKDHLYMSTLLAVKSNAPANTVSVDAFDINKIEIYPNPMHEILSITIPEHMGTSCIKVIDVVGNVVQTQIMSSSKTTLHVADLKPGVYFVETRLEGADLAFTLTKIIKQ